MLNAMSHDAMPTIRSFLNDALLLIDVLLFYVKYLRIILFSLGGFRLESSA